MGKGKKNKTTTEYRFHLGTKVLCRTGPEEWSAGEIVQLNYTEPDWTRIMPYQVRLDDGALIGVPVDIEELCCKFVPPWWVKVFAGKTESHFFEDPPSDVIRKESTGKNIDEADHQGWVALTKAVEFNWYSGVIELLQLKADVNICTAQKKYPLHCAIPHGEAMTKVIIDAKADLNCQADISCYDSDFNPDFTNRTFGSRREHFTPLHIAVLAEDVRTASLLVNAGANLDIPDAEYKTALHWAIYTKNIEIIAPLLNHKADVNLGNREAGMKNTPLMDAAYTRDLELVKMLLLARAAINRQGKQGMSALQLAARAGDAEIVRVLLEVHADLNQESQCGTVADLARKNGGDELLKVLGFSKGAEHIANSLVNEPSQCNGLFTNYQVNT